MSDAKDIAVHNGGGTAVAPATGSSGQMLAMIADAARDPTVDAQKMTTLADLAIKLQDRERQEQFNRDKVASIIAMPTIRRDGVIVIPGKNGAPDRVQGRFAKYETLAAVIDPILASHNLVLTHNVDTVGNGMISVQPILSHTNGIVEKGGAMPLQLETSGSKNNVQAAGSSVSYGMRYTACAMLHIRIAGIDDDGNQGRHDGEADDRYNDDQRALRDAGRSAAMEGADAYARWFGGLDAASKGWLVYERLHDQNKQAAAAADQH